MNLLMDAWIPIQAQGQYQKITLQQLLCGEQSGDLCLPRDDMELACLQLLCAIAQALITPKDKKELGKLVMQPLSIEMYANACQEKSDWFDLNHPKTPFMQFRGVRAEKFTPMDKLLAGVADGTSKTFVNQPNLADKLCGSCIAISLFNMANNAPSVGGGFQGGFRGNTPITILIKGKSLRETIWLNVLTEESIENILPWHEKTKNQKPNWIDHVKPGVELDASSTGFIRGLLWQPAHYELVSSNNISTCSCCGCKELVYQSFIKEKFKYTFSGYWPHPLSPTKFDIDKSGGRFNVTFSSFTTSAPAWTHLSSFLYADSDKKEGSSPPPVVTQIKPIFNGRPLEIIVGGYRYKPPQTATITDRRHEMFSLPKDWDSQEIYVRNLIETAIEYKKALRRGLYSFVSGALINPVSKKNKDRIGEICGIFDAIYYQQTESLIHSGLIDIKNGNSELYISQLREQLKPIVNSLFNQATAPYQQEPKMLKALALARRSLHKSLRELEPQGETP